MTIKGKKHDRIRTEGNFKKCRKDVGSNTILCHFYKWWVLQRCIDIRGRLKQDDEFENIPTRIKHTNRGASRHKFLVWRNSIMFYVSGTYPVKKGDVIRRREWLWLEINDTRMGRWMCSVIPEDRISAMDLRNRQQLISMREWNRRLQWFNPLVRMEEGSWLVNVKSYTLVVG